MSQQDFSPIVTLTDSEVEGQDFRLSSDPYEDSDAQDVEERESLNRLEESVVTFSPSLGSPSLGSPSLGSPSLGSDSSSDWTSQVDVYADRLMDEIFTPVEHTLDSGVAPLEFEETEVLRIRSLEMPTLSFPSALVPRVDAYSPQEGSALAVLSAQEVAVHPSPLVDRVLLGSVLVSCAITLGWWALDRDRYDVLLSSTPAEAPLTASQPQAPPSPDAQFVAYLQESLKTLETSQTGGNSQGATGTSTAPTTPTGAVASLPGVPAGLPANVPSGGTLPTVTVPGTPALGDLTPLPSTTQNTVLDRVYIPVYPNTPGLAAPQSAVASSLPGVLNPAPPLVASGNFPTPPTGAPVPIAAAPVAAPGKAASSPTAQNPTAAVAPLPEVGSVTHSLVGILELGDQSAALFQINGVTRRVHLGEAIGSAGWMLVDVSNQEAVIRRNGEVRSVYIGQNF